MTSFRYPRSLWSLLAVIVLTQSALHLARPMISYRALSLGADAGQVGFVAAAFALLPAVVAVPLGRRAPRIRPGRLVAAGTLLLAASVALLARAACIVELAVWSATLGLGHLLLMVGAQSMTAASSPSSERDRRFGLFGTAAGVGQLVGPALGGAVAAGAASAAAAASASPDPATARALLVAAGLAVLALAGVPYLPASASTAERDTTLPAPGMVNQGRWLRRPGVGAVMVTSLALLSCLDLITVYLPVLGKQIGIGAGTVGVLLSLRAAATTAVRLFVGPLAERCGRVRLLAAGIAVSVVPIVALPAGSSVVSLAVGVVAAGLFLGVGQPLAIAWLVSLVPREAQAQALTFRLGANRAGQVAAPAIAGVVAGAAGVGAVFWGLGALLALASATAFARSGTGS